MSLTKYDDLKSLARALLYWDEPYDDSAKDRTHVLFLARGYPGHSGILVTRGVKEGTWVRVGMLEVNTSNKAFLEGCER